MKFSLCLVFILLSIHCFAQKQYNTWCFGLNAMIDFNITPPSGNGTSAIIQHSGCASISDNNGQLLFYSDGVKVWNRSHQQMPNGFGLLGNWGATQSALIIPMPGSNSIYYIFTAPGNQFDPLSYSIVDMNLNGGMGDVTIKNVTIHVGAMTDKLTATLKSNGIDYWIIAREGQSQKFVTYSFTSAGLNLVPVVSQVPYVPMAANNEEGYARVSPDGSKLAVVQNQDPHIVQLYDFDHSNGQVSNPLNLTYSTNADNWPYGVEFSPDNSKLYVLTDPSCELLQFDLLAGSSAAIQSSVIQIFIGPYWQYHGGALMRGPDNKIYVCNYNNNYVSVIDKPNLAGSACNFISQAVQLTGICRQGFPNNINYPVCSPVLSVGSDVTICTNQTYQLPSGTSVSATGIYYDTIRNASGCDSVITTLSLFVFPIIYTNNSAQICSGQTYQLASGEIVSDAGIYQDTIRSVNSCDSLINITHLSVNSISSINFIDSIFEGEPYVLPWGQTVNSAGFYQTVLTNSLGCDSVINVTLKKKIHLSNCLILKNAFTPNGDGVNDYWILSHYHCFRKMEVNVYNRYGSMVYHSDDYNNDWNGTYRNKTLPDATYYYTIKIFSFSDREYFYKGNVTILR